MNGIFTTTRLRGLRAILAVGAVAFAYLAASCAPIGRTESPAVDTDALAKMLTQLDDDWSKAAATRNAETVASYYAANAIAYPPNEPVSVGQAAAQKVWAAYFADSTFTISWKTDHAEVSKSGDLGFTAGTYEDSFRGPDGAMIHEVGKYLCVWEKQADGSWNAVHDMWNADTK